MNRRRHWTEILAVVGLPLAWAALAAFGYWLGGEVTARAWPDYQRIAAATPWAWSDQQANAAYCATQVPPRYRAEFAPPPRPTFGGPYDGPIVIWEGDRKACTFQSRAQGDAVFRIVGRRLYYADFSPGDSGGSVVAVDLNSGAVQWASPLVALGGPVMHSTYLNQILLDADAHAVRVYGKEEFGHYVEIKDAATGTTVGHQLCPGSRDVIGIPAPARRLA